MDEIQFNVKSASVQKWSMEYYTEKMRYIKYTIIIIKVQLK